MGTRYFLHQFVNLYIYILCIQGGSKDLFKWKNSLHFRTECWHDEVTPDLTISIDIKLIQYRLFYIHMKRGF